MYYAPHIMQKRIQAAETNDEFGRPVPAVSEGLWRNVCRCRCDDNGSTEVELPDGSIVRVDFRVVCEGNNPDVANGDYVRCVCPDGSVRGCGKVVKPKTLNYLPYAEVYLQS